eukprot:COSAG01_NODE_13246_length_1613_cov_1.658520_3_plen_93_part_00
MIDAAARPIVFSRETFTHVFVKPPTRNPADSRRGYWVAVRAHMHKRQQNRWNDVQWWRKAVLVCKQHKLVSPPLRHSGEMLAGFEDTSEVDG